MVRRSSDFENLSAILPKMFKSMGLKKQYKHHLLYFYWQRIVGNDIAKNVRPVRISFQKLFLKAANPSWANQIMLMKLELMKKVNSYLGENIIHDICFCKAEPVKDIEEREKEEEKNFLFKNIFKEKPQKEEISAAENKCREIKDEEIRGKLRFLYVRYLQKEKVLLNSYGWHKCKGCSYICPPEDEYCTACALKNKKEISAKIREFLSEMPWARYSDVYKYISCTAEMVNKERASILQQILGRLKPEDNQSLDARIAAMLYLSLPPEQLTEEKTKQALHRLRYDINRKWRKSIKKEKWKSKLDGKKE